MPIMRKHIAIVALFLSFLLFVACSKDNESDTPREEGPNKQTIIIFFPWSGTTMSNGLYYFITQNVREIQKAIVDNKGFSQSRFVCFMSNSAESAVMYEMKYEKGKCVNDTVQRYSSPDFSDASTLQHIIADAIGHAPAERYGMVVGGHGSGWLPAPSTIKKKTRFIGGYSGVYATDTPVFAQALNALGQKMDFILFDNCYMANIEVAYDLRDATDMMIASTSEIIERGIPYQDIFKYLVGSPDYERLIAGFHDFYKSYTYPFGALSAIDCTQTEKMAAIMRRINSQTVWNAYNNNLVQKLDGYSPGVFYDMGDYVRHLCEDPVLLSEFEQALKQLVPYTSCTDNLYTELTTSQFVVSTFSGITISDPSENSMAAGKTSTNWYQATH